MAEAEPSISVAALLRPGICHQGELILVHQQNGLVGPPAGTIDPGELPTPAILREISQEVNLSGQKVICTGPTKTIALTNNGRTSMGIIYEFCLDPSLPEDQQTWLIKDPDKDVVLASIFDICDVWRLLKENNEIYKVKFNTHVFLDWIINLANDWNRQARRLLRYRLTIDNPHLASSVIKDGDHWRHIWDADIDIPIGRTLEIP